MNRGSTIVVGGEGPPFVTDVPISATKKLILDGVGGHTYIYEHLNDVLHIVVGGLPYIQIDQNLNAMSFGAVQTPQGFARETHGSAFISNGSSSILVGNYHIGSLTGANLDTEYLVGSFFGNTIITQGNGDTISHITQVRIVEPFITNSGDTITRASSLWIVSVPTEAGAGGNNAIYMPVGAFEVSDGQGASGEQLASGGVDGNLSWTTAASVRESKQDIVLRADNDAALATIIGTPIYDFKYRRTEYREYDTGDGNMVKEPIPGKRFASTGDYDTDYVGPLSDEAPWAMHHEGRILNPINTFGYTVMAFKAIERRVRELEAA